MFADRARIWVQGGAGGDGSTSFRREAHVPKGGPDGGDGGRGGDVVLVCDASRRDLGAFRRGAHFRAKRGGHGEGTQRHGANAATLEVPVPPGTVAEDAEREARWDLTAPGQRAVVARGGPGGKGNKRFAGSTRQAPRFAERGLPGEEGWLELRLKLMADAGLVGLPNAGKSSLLARMTRAAPAGGRLPVHHARAGAGHDRGRRPPAGAGRHPGPDRGRQRRRRAGPRVPGPRRALPAARARGRPGAGRRQRPGRQPRHGRGRAARARRRAGRAAAADRAVEGGPGARRRTPRPPAERWRARTGAEVFLTSAATGRGPARAARRAAARGARRRPRRADAAAPRPSTASTGPAPTTASRSSAPASAPSA